MRIQYTLSIRCVRASTIELPKIFCVEAAVSLSLTTRTLFECTQSLMPGIASFIGRHNKKKYIVRLSSSKHMNRSILSLTLSLPCSIHRVAGWLQCGWTTLDMDEYMTLYRSQCYLPLNSEFISFIFCGSQKMFMASAIDIRGRSSGVGIYTLCILAAERSHISRISGQRSIVAVLFLLAPTILAAEDRINKAMAPCSMYL